MLNRLINDKNTYGRLIPLFNEFNVIEVREAISSDEEQSESKIPILVLVIITVILILILLAIAITFYITHAK